MCRGVPFPEPEPPQPVAFWNLAPFRLSEMGLMSPQSSSLLTALCSTEGFRPKAWIILVPPASASLDGAAKAKLSHQSASTLRLEPFVTSAWIAPHHAHAAPLPTLFRCPHHFALLGGLGSPVSQLFSPPPEGVLCRSSSLSIVSICESTSLPCSASSLTLRRSLRGPPPLLLWPWSVCGWGGGGDT